LLEAGKFYRNVPVMMVGENAITGYKTQPITVASGTTLTMNNIYLNTNGAPAIVLEDNATLILKGINTISTTNAEAIKCEGNATIDFQSTMNSISAVTNGMRGIQIADGKSLNITGTGSASLNGNIGVPAGASLKFNGQTASHEIYIPDATTLSASGITVGSTITIGSGESFMLSWTTINVTSGPAIQCSGDATIILDGTNTVKTTAERYPAIKIGGIGTTLTIQGSGSVTATGGIYAAGIGGGITGYIYGNITINARGSGGGAGIGCGDEGQCGNIIISGGTVNAEGVAFAAGIGSGNGSYSKFESINITDGITSVIAIMSDQGPKAPIGRGNEDTTSGTVTIDGVVNPTSSSTFEHLTLSESGLTWTLTHK
jgi:hypothetical protein